MTNGPAPFPDLSAPVHKERLSKQQRLVRLLQGVVDPRVWAHMLKVANQYNYGHVTQLRAFRYGPDAEISPNANFLTPKILPPTGFTWELNRRSGRDPPRGDALG